MVFQRKLIFAQGKSNETAGNSTLTQGQKVLSVTDAGIKFGLNDQIWISESAGSEIESLGRVVAIDTHEVTVEYSVGADKGAGWLIWTSTAGLLFSKLPASPYFRNKNPRVNQFDTTGGQLFETKVGDTVIQRVISWPFLPDADFDNYEDFFFTSSGNVVGKFTFVNEEGESYISKLIIDASLPTKASNIYTTVALSVTVRRSDTISYI